MSFEVLKTGGPGGWFGVCGGRQLAVGPVGRGVLIAVAIVGMLGVADASSAADIRMSETAVVASAALAAGLATSATAPVNTATASATAAPSAAHGIRLSAAPGSAVPQAPIRTVLSPQPRSISDFTLTTADEKPLKLSQLSGTPTLVFFGFSHCPSICPAALTQLRMLEVNHAADLAGTKIVVISVDGDRDTPSMLHDWLKPISPTFIGLTGPTQTVHDIAAQFSAAFFKGSAQPSGDYLVEHNSQIFLLDAQGRLRATFFDAPVDTMAQVTRSIAAETATHAAN